MKRDKAAVIEKEESLMSYLAEHEAVLKHSASLHEEASQATEEAQVSKDVRAEAHSEDLFAEAFTTGVPMFFGVQGSPFSLDEPTCPATQRDGVSPTAPFRCANAPAD